MMQGGLIWQWTFNKPLKKSCQALFLRRNGSIWALLIKLPTKGVDSFLRAVNSVIFDRRTFSDIVFPADESLNFSTYFTTFSLALYSHGCQLLFLPVPKVPLRSLQLSLFTLAKVQKYLAEFGNSPANRANIFMSFGNSLNLKLHVFYQHQRLYLQGLKFVCIHFSCNFAQLHKILTHS